MASQMLAPCHAQPWAERHRGRVWRWLESSLLHNIQQFLRGDRGPSWPPCDQFTAVDASAQRSQGRPQRRTPAHGRAPVKPWQHPTLSCEMLFSADVQDPGTGPPLLLQGE